MTAAPDQRVQSLLQDIRLNSEARFGLVSAVRKLALGLSKEVQEDVKYGGILFSCPDPFGGVFVYAHHVTVEFSAGASLADPHKVLEGSGKLRRHIKLVEAADVERKHVRHYLAAARAKSLG